MNDPRTSDDRDAADGTDTERRVADGRRTPGPAEAAVRAAIQQAPSAGAGRIGNDAPERTEATRPGMDPRSRAVRPGMDPLIWIGGIVGFTLLAVILIVVT